MKRFSLFALLLLWIAPPLAAQSDALRIATVERPPFAFVEDGELTGFSIELMKKVGRELNIPVTFDLKDDFLSMLNAVETAQVDGAVANISITGAREAVMDFTLPIFGNGLQIMVPADDNRPSIIWALLNRELGLAILGAVGLLFGIGMLLWVFERDKQSYFDHNARQAVFPAFWYALNLVVSGGFGQSHPRSVMGRLFAVVLVLSSLFVLSFLVASLTTVMTLRALEDRVDSISDLEGLLVATTEGSTASRPTRQRAQEPHDRQDR